MMDNNLMELRLLNVNETEKEKKFKKIVFLFISIIFPLFELISLLLHFANIYKTKDDFYLIFFTVSFISFLLTVGMMSVCYDKNTAPVIICKTLIIIISLILVFSDDHQYHSSRYYLVFYVIGYGTFYTLIFVYKSFKKGLI